jgi:hypothetical protein
VNNCEDTCDRLDCKERGCIGPVSTVKEKMIIDVMDKTTKLEEAERLIDRAKALLAMDKAKLKEQCNGTCVHLFRKKEHYPGGYLNKSMTKYIDTCHVCGYYKIVKTEYGGYG